MLNIGSGYHVTMDWIIDSFNWRMNSWEQVYLFVGVGSIKAQVYHLA